MLNFDCYINNPSPGYVIGIYKRGEVSFYTLGNRCTNPTILETMSDTLYDIASLTKVFTSTLIYIAYEEKLIDIYDYVYNIDNNFVNLKDVKVIDLISHNQEIWTDGYLGSATSREEFYKILYTACVKNNIPTYVDSHYIILSTLLEKVYNMSYKDLCYKKIINKLGLKNTTFDPDSSRTASNNYENNNGKIIDYIHPGVIHDTKARVAKELGITTGHASLFTTANDLMIFLKTFFDYTLLSKDTIELMLKHEDINTYNYDRLKIYSNSNDINVMYNDALKKEPNLYVSRTYNNMGTRYRNDIDLLNDVPSLASDKSISFSGFTGPMFTIDFERKIIVVIMCNVMHNTKLGRDERKNKVVSIMNYIFEEI